MESEFTLPMWMKNANFGQYYKAWPWIDEISNSDRIKDKTILMCSLALGRLRYSLGAWRREATPWPNELCSLPLLWSLIRWIPVVQAYLL